MLLNKIMTKEVVTIGQNASLYDAAKKMREYHVGDLVVVEYYEGKELPVGILTDRDIVLECAAFDIDLKQVSVGDAMTSELICIHDSADIFEVLKIFKTKGIRRVPVISTKGIIEGIVSLDDLLYFLISQLSSLSKFKESQLRREVNMRAEL